MATQMHKGLEGILVHQLGHVFFLLSMVGLIFTITGKGLNLQKGWRMIQYAAFSFILWNLDALAVHFFDNQVHAVSMENISLSKVKIISESGAPLLTYAFYIMKLDHLLCVPAMLFLYRGLSSLVTDEKNRQKKAGSP
jgi:hypothetical protein